MENPWGWGRILKRINTTRITTVSNDDCAIVEGIPKEEEVKQPLSPWSNVFHNPATNVHILAIFGSQTPLDERGGKECIRQLILKHPRFSSIVVGDKREELKWVRIPKVRFDDFLVVPVIDPTITPGSKMADRYVEKYVYSLSKERLDGSRPLWDLHFLKLKTSKEEGIMILRAHHSLGDGVSLMSLLLSCSRSVSDPTTLPTLPVSHQKKKKKNGGIGMRNCCWRVLLGLWWNLVLIWNTIVDGLKMLATMLCLLKDTNTPIKGRSSTAAFRPRKCVYRTICLDDIKLVKAKMDVTINDVAVGITQAGLSYYLNRRYSNDLTYKVGEPNIEKKMHNKLPKNIRLRSAITVNLRPKGIQDFSEDTENNYSKQKWGNLIGILYVPFAIGFPDDPLDYVRQAKNIVDRKKHSLEAAISFLVLKIVPKLFGQKAIDKIIDRSSANTTLVFSNVVGPSEEIFWCGHHINFMAVTAYGQPQALWVAFISCGNQMTLTVSADEDTIPDPEQLCDDIVGSLGLIKEAAAPHHV